MIALIDQMKATSVQSTAAFSPPRSQSITPDHPSLCLLSMEAANHLSSALLNTFPQQEATFSRYISTPERHHTLHSEKERNLSAMAAATFSLGTETPAKQTQSHARRHRPKYRHSPANQQAHQLPIPAFSFNFSS